MALYRKYRPSSFAEVVGQEHVTDPLSVALRSGRINHAYLFSGPRGCGKTSSARILARSLNCVQGPTPEPCGVCNSCVALAPGGPGNLDVTELDAASHGGVDDTRELRERAFFAPASSRYRVLIIDEAHMVTTAGFNALLKIVEEPPEHLIFVFATTEPEKVLPTIRSRTHHYPFRLLTPTAMRGLVERICADEGVTVDPAVLPLVIRSGGGSPRDTLSVLDQLMAGAEAEGITYPRAVALLGATEVALIDSTVDALAVGDGASLFRTVDRVIEAGHDPRRFATDLLQRLRDLIMVQSVPQAIERGLVDAPGEQAETLERQAAAMGQATLTRCADLVHEGMASMRGATSPRLLLEIVCARLLLPSADDSMEALLHRVETLERGLPVSPGGGGTADRPAAPGPGVGDDPSSSTSTSSPAPDVSGDPGGGTHRFIRRSQAAPTREGQSAPAETPAQPPPSAPSIPAAPTSAVPGPADPPEPESQTAPPSLAETPVPDAAPGSAERNPGDGSAGAGFPEAPAAVVASAAGGGAGAVREAASGADDDRPAAGQGPEAVPSAPVQEPDGRERTGPDADAEPAPDARPARPGPDARPSTPPEPAQSPVSSAPTRSPAGAQPSGSAPVSGLEAEDLRRGWNEVRSAVRERTRTVEVMLSGASVATVEGRAVTLVHDSAPLANRLGQPHNAGVIAQALGSVFGGEWTVRCVVAGSLPGGAAGAAATGPSSGPAQTATPAQQAPAGRDEPRGWERRIAGRASQQGGQPGGYDDLPPPPEEPEPGPPEPPEEVGPPPPEVSEDEMIAEARSGPQNIDHRTNQEIALQLLREHLGARPIDR